MIDMTNMDMTAADIIDAEEDDRHDDAVWFAAWRLAAERSDYLPADD